MANLNDLDPRFRGLAEAWVGALKAIDARFVVTSARRSYQEQQDLWNRYQRGEKTGLFTPMPPGKSAHERGLAIDIVRMGVDATTDPLLHAVGRVWREAGLVWGGSRDPVHFAVREQF